MPIPPDSITVRIAELCRLYLRGPVSIATDETTGAPIIVFEPPLTTAEQATYADIVAMAKAGITLSLVEYQGIKTFLATMRTFQQMSQSDFIALAQNARDRQLFDVVSALIRVVRTLMRD